jgi:integrase
MLELAKAKNVRDFYLMKILRYSLRIGEVVGDNRLHGIRTMDLRQDGIWIRGKGGTEKFVHFPLPFCGELSRVAPRTMDERLFPISERRAEYLVKDYAKQAGVEDWEYISPHRLRAFFATDLKDRGIDGFTIRDMMRHKNIQTTNTYVGPPTPKRQAEIVNSLSV